MRKCSRRKTRRLIAICSMCCALTSLLVCLIFLSYQNGYSKDKMSWKRSKFQNIPIKWIKFNNSDHSQLSFTIEIDGNIQNSKPDIRLFSDIALIKFKPKDYSLQKCLIQNVYNVHIPIQIQHTFEVNISYKNELLIKTHHKINDTYIVDKQYSTMKCHGTNYLDRFCEINNTCFNDKKFAFFTPYDINFNQSVMYPGSRPIPFDYPSCRKIARFISKKMKFSEFNATEYVNEHSFLTCRWYGMQHFWHTMYDYTLPLWWTISNTGGKNKSDRVFLIDENTSEKGLMFAPAFSNEKIKNIRINKSEGAKCFKRAVIGFPKSEKEVTPSKWTNGYDMPYEYPPEAFKGFREHMLSHYKIGECSRQSKRVVLAVRHKHSRRIENEEELISKMKEWCPSCQIDVTTFEMPIDEQLSFVCNASVLIAVHGSGLSHMAWLEKGSSIIEILPYKYDCRDWYRQIADGAGMHYFKWLNTNRSNTFEGRTDRSDYLNCLEKEGACMTDCHESLRDQRTFVDLNEFKKVFVSALKDM